MKGVSCASSTTVLFIGCLAAVGQCGRLEAVGGYPDGGANRSVDATTMDSSPDGSKVSLRLCAPRDCKTKGGPWNDDCVCCLVMPGVPCWHSMKECQANCRACHPKCPTASAKKELHV